MPEIRSLTKTMFSDLLTLLESQSSWASKVGPQRVEELSGDSYADIPKTGFCELLAQRLTRSQWYVKGRYALLCTVATRLGFEKMLSLSPSLIEECIKCLQINNLAPQGIRLISELSKAARKEWEIELFGKYKGPLTSGGKSSSSKSKANLAELEVREIAIAAKWSTVWKDMMLSALAGDDQHTRGQVAVYWLPETMKLFPAALNSIVTEYTALLGYGADGSPVEGFVDTSTAEGRSRRLGALMVAIKSARGAGLLSNNSLHGGPTLAQSEEYDDDCSDVSSDEDDDDDNINVGGSCEAKSGDEPKSRITSTLMAIAVPYALVHEALCHSDRQIQMDGLAFVCCDLRTTAELTTSELTLLREFIPRNMNMSDAGTRQQFLSLLKAALCRLRDSWIAHSTTSNAAARKLQRHDAEHGSDVDCDICLNWICEMDEHEDGINRTGDVMVEFVEWLESISIASLYPGASYQRALTGICTFGVLYDVFNEPPSNVEEKKGDDGEENGVKINLGLKKGDDGEENGERNDFNGSMPFDAWPELEWPDGFPNLNSSRNSSVLIGAVLNPHEDVRTKASAILANDFSGPVRHQQVEGGGVDVSGIRTATYVANSARILIASGHVHECEIGAELFKVLFSNFVIKRNGIFKIAASTESSSSSSTDIYDATSIRLEADFCRGGTAASAIAFIELLFQLIQSQLDICRADLAKASREAVHSGLLLALRNIWTSFNPSIIADTSQWTLLVERAVNLALNVGTFALSTLVVDEQAAGTFDDDDSNAPISLGSTNFGNSEAALDQAVIKHSPAVRSAAATVHSAAATHATATMSPKTVSSAAETQVHSAPRHESTRDFVLAMSWRTLKETSLFLGTAFGKSRLPGEGSAAKEDGGSMVDAETIERVGTWMHRVLVSCRHRGVIETCAAGLGALCKRLSKSSPEMQQIPAKWLDSCLALLTSGSSVSITRRGAGLPCVLHAIVANVRTPKLVERAFVELLAIAANQTVPDGWDETTDLPAVRALNALNILFRDARLTEASQPFMAEATIITIGGFAASEWAIANTCMMVFGTLAQKMLGTKRVKDDRSHINLVTAREFFARYPSLRDFIRARLQAIVGLESTQRLVDPELYPLLTLLSRLQSNAEADPEQAIEMQVFVELLAELTGNCIFAIRSLAARALVPIVPWSESGKSSILWLGTIPASPSDDVVVQNSVHGSLLSAHGFLAAWLSAPQDVQAIDAGSEEVAISVSRVAWLLDPSQNPCSFTAAAYGDICNALLSAMVEKPARNANFSILVERLRSIGAPTQFVADQHTIGDWWHQSAFAEVVWRTRITAGAHATKSSGSNLLTPSPASPASQLLSGFLATPNADVRMHSYGLLIQGANALGGNSTVKLAYSLPADVGHIIARACYRELTSTDGRDTCKTASVEALIAVGEKRSTVDAIGFPVASGGSGGGPSLSASMLWDSLIETATISEDDRLQEASDSSMTHPLRFSLTRGH